MEYKTIRRSQYISPFGVGAIYDFSGESMIAVDIKKWTGDYGEILRLKRGISESVEELEEFLGEENARN